MRTDGASSGHKKMSELLRHALGQKAGDRLISEYPEILKDVKAGMPAPTVADLIVTKLTLLAADPNKSNQWAVQLVFDYSEGKPATQETATHGRFIEDKLDDVTKHHLDQLSQAFIAKEDRERLDESGAVGHKAAEEQPDRPAASPLLDLPTHGGHGPQGRT